LLDELLQRYPLPSGWASLEHFRETVDLAPSSIELSGVSVVGPHGDRVTGSAASIGSSGRCVARSYFELLERVSIIVASGSSANYRELLDRSGRTLRSVKGSDLFAESPWPNRWRPSRSNGVALHASWQEACDRAAAELVERDRVLRSWYGESIPLRLPLPQSLIPEGAHSLAEWAAYELSPASSAIGNALTVVAVVGLPRIDTTPLAYGFAAAIDPRAATTAAAIEAVQRLGFLLGEEIPREIPPFSPTPDFHQEFFLHPPARTLLEEWLNCAPLGDRTFSREANAQTEHRPTDEPIWFVDLTPPHLRGSLFVAKALCPMAEPLVFGEPAPHRAGVSASRRVHPIA
jgi:hypothetical protein